MKRVTTGISGMNVLLMGGLPRASMILVIGRPGSGKSTLGIRFLYEGLTRKQPAILISTSPSIDMLLKEIILTYNWNSKVLSKLIYMDCHSWMAGITRERYSANLTKLREVNITFNSIIENQSITPQHDARLVIDTFSDLLLYNPSNLALEFLKDLKSRLFEYNISSLILVEEGAHDDRIVSSLESITDETIRLKIDEVFRYTHEKLY
ncbi:MAG: hypothetical protein H3Z50_03230 [archaeon]|nr:hypothetical protein [archaeon]MCP8306066.1 hypothetical protein [archaeon]